mgnify:FL=1
MKKYPYSLVVRKVIFCACSDLLGRLRQARPDETDHYKTVQVAPIKGAGPVLVEYSLKKHWPENDKDRQQQYLGRILQLQNGVSIVFHKKSSWRIEFRDAEGNIVDRCKRNDKAEAIRQKIKNCLEDAYPHYKNFNLSERFVETLIKPFRDIWMDFVDISKKALSPMCKGSESPQLFWDLGDQVFFFEGDLEPFTAKESGLCWFSRTKYTLDFEYFQDKGHGDWLWLHNSFKDKELHLKPIRSDNEIADVLSKCGAFEIVYNCKETDETYS